MRKYGRTVPPAHVWTLSVMINMNVDMVINII
jgi:hypothetical protein